MHILQMFAVSHKIESRSKNVEAKWMVCPKETKSSIWQALFRLEMFGDAPLFPDCISILGWFEQKPPISQLKT